MTGRWEQRCRSGRARRTPSARRSTAPARTSPSSPRSPNGSSCACSTPTGAEQRVDLVRGRRVRLARLPARACSRASGTASGCTARTTRRGAAVQPRQAAARPLRQGRRRADRLGPRPASATGSATPAVRNDADSAPHVPKSVVINPFFDWADDRAPRTPYHEIGHLRGARQGPHDAPSGDPRGAARHVRRARAPGDASSTYTAARRHGDRADAGAPVRARTTTWSSAGCATTGATTRSGSSPRTTRTAASGTDGQQVREFKAMVRDLHAAGIEVILDVVYNHTAEGNELGPDAVVPRHRQRRLLPPGRRRHRSTTTTRPAPATAC